MGGTYKMQLFLVIALSTISWVLTATDPNDVAILKKLRDGLSNPELLQWPENDDDPCGVLWKHILCNGTRVSQIQVQNLGLKGSLPSNLNQLTALTDLGLQGNHFSGHIPSFSGLSGLRRAYLDNNSFDAIPSDFFVGLDSLQVLSLNNIDNLHSKVGWMFPVELQNSEQLINLTCNNCNLRGPLPEFLGKMASLNILMLASNNLTGEIPASFAGSTSLQVMWLNNQKGGGMIGPINVVVSMPSLTSLWLHGNSFSGKIPANISDLVHLKSLILSGNQLSGLVPDSLVDMELDTLELDNNHLMGPTPKFKSPTATCSSNAFCLQTPGAPCSPEVMALIGFLDGLGYPSQLLSSWLGNDPCEQPWFGLRCNDNRRVSMINLPKNGLSGLLSPSVPNLASLAEIRLESNKLQGSVPWNWTNLKLLTYLDLSNNNLGGPLPNFSSSVKVVVSGNPLLITHANQSVSLPPSSDQHSPPSKRKILIAIVAPTASLALLLAVIVTLYLLYRKKQRKDDDSDEAASHASPSLTGSGSASSRNSSCRLGVIETGNLVISVQVLRNATSNFAPENELGRGGFGVVYKGELEDGTKIAVKRMEAGVISNKALNEFQSEIEVLSKVRHRHLVSLLGYSAEGHERILVYEYMLQGALSRHLFHWKTSNLEPLSWKRRLNIALDVARAMEYLHSLAHHTFIHRDLKSSNILLGHDFRAKVSDFGLVKLVPAGEQRSVATKLAGTFGYLAPEYAVTGRITTKADVFSFGVILMELLTGLKALDEGRPEEKRYLVGYIQSDKEKLMSAIDPILLDKTDEETLESTSVIAELAAYCTVREPNQRPDMRYAVNVLAPLVEKWTPMLHDQAKEECSGIDYSVPLNQMVKNWQESEEEEEKEGKKSSSYRYMDYLDDTQGSIPARPAGFAYSFTSADTR